MNFGLSYDELCEIWFALMGVLLTGYAVLDGFDLGVGVLHPFVARNSDERRLAMNSIGPIWDGNEVWLVVFGGAMFAMFPDLYASVFSGFYTAFMLLLGALLLRAVSFDFRGKVERPFWRNIWDGAFFVGSGVAALLFGVAIGNVLRGVPLSVEGDFLIGVQDQLGFYPVLVGMMVVSLFAMHGSIYLYLKTEGEFQEHVHHYVWKTFGVFMALFMFTTMVTLVELPHVVRHFADLPLLWILPAGTVLAIANIPRCMYLRRPAYAFASSCAVIAALVGLLGAAMYPNLLADTAHPERSLTVFNCASSPATLNLGLLFVLIGMPFVVCYSALVYWTFRGKVRLTKASY